AAAVFDRRGITGAGDYGRARRETLEDRLCQQVVWLRRGRNVCRLERSHALARGKHAGEPQVRRVRDLHHLDAKQDERRAAILGRKRIEVVEQLFAAVVRLDAATMDDKIPVQTMSPAEGRAFALEMRLGPLVFRIGRIDLRFLVFRLFLLLVRQTRIRELRRRLYADADHFLGVW